MEDAPAKTADVEQFMVHLKSLIEKKKSSLRLVQLNVPTPTEIKLKPKEARWRKPRGVLQRNHGLSWIRDHIFKLDPDGVIYFADDDNTYDVRLFEEMRDTKKVSCWPVALVGGRLVEKPLVINGQVIGFDAWKPKRKYAMDMAAFAINIHLFKRHPGAQFSLVSRRGFLEEDFLNQLIAGREELEPKANQCTSVFVWHTRTEAFTPVQPAT